MPLPIQINYVDENHVSRSAELEQKGSPAPAPTNSYHPTMRIVKCSSCGGVGIAEFVNGFSYTQGDKLMEFKPIPGQCLRCNKAVELVPLKLGPNEEGQLKMLYNIQRSLDEMRARGMRVDPSSIIWPVERIKERERQAGL